MSPRKKFYIFVPGFWLSLILLAVLTAKVHGAFLVGIPILFLVFAFWQLFFFSCPKCGKAYLYGFIGPFVYPTWMPRKCRRCGLSTDIDPSKGEEKPYA